MSASKSAHADSAPEDSEITISVDELIRTRTQLVTGLTSISAAINEFVRSYVQHTDKWIGKETQLPSGIDISAMSNLFGAGPSSADAFLPASANAAGAAAGKRGPYNKKGEKKPRKVKDPNAPKRPLTAYFLYSQYARSVVKQDFESSGVTPSAAQVSEEILRRWKNMTAEEHVPWKELYEKNAEAYRKDTEAYKAKTGAAPPEDDEEEAHAGAGAIEETPDIEAGHSEVPATAPAATTASATKPPKAVKGKGKKKDATPAAGPGTQAAERDSPSAQLISKVSAVPIPGTQPEAPAAKSTKRKSEAVENKSEKPAKKKRKTKAEKEAEEAAAAAAKPATAASEPAPEKKRKTKGKKDKSSD